LRFAHQFTDTSGRRSSRDVPNQERHLLRLLKNPSRLRYEVIPVAEWRPERCSRIYGETDRRLLLRLFEHGPGTELGRFSLHESGQLGTLSFPGDPRFGLELRDGHRLEPLEVSSKAARRSSLEPEPGSLQYVAVASPTIPCYDSVPCTVFRRGERIYLYRSGKLFELRHVEIQVAVSELVHEGSERELATAALGSGDHLVTLGDDVMTLAVPVEPPTPSQ
jgi:hypothetical protein